MEKQKSSAEALTRNILEANMPKNRTQNSTNKSFNSDAAYMEKVKALVINASIKSSPEVHKRILNWALNKSKELRKKHFIN